MIISQTHEWNIWAVIGTVTLSALNVTLSITKSSKESRVWMGLTMTNGVTSFKFTRFSGLNPGTGCAALGGASARQCQRVALGAKCKNVCFHLASKTHFTEHTYGLGFSLAIPG